MCWSTRVALRSLSLCLAEPLAMLAHHIGVRRERDQGTGVGLGAAPLVLGKAWHGGRHGVYHFTGATLHHSRHHRPSQ